MPEDEEGPRVEYVLQYENGGNEWQDDDRLGEVEPVAESIAKLINKIGNENTRELRHHYNYRIVKRTDNGDILEVVE